MESSYSDIDPNSAVVAEWGFNNDANDQTGNGNNATLYGSPSYNTNDYQEGSASLNLNGTSQYASAGLVTTSVKNITMSAWVMWNGGSGQQFVDYNGTFGTNGYGMYLDSGTFKVSCGGVGNVVSSTTLTSGVWTHLAAVNNNGTWSLYINGSSIAITSGGSTIPNIPGGSNTIGCNCGTGYFYGLLDDIRMYDSPLNATAISELAMILSNGTFEILCGGAGYIITNTTLATGQWYHLAAVYTSGAWTLYVNGSAVSISSGGNTVPNTPTGSTVISAATGYSFIGLLDDIRIYNSALNGSQIASLASGSTDTQPPTVPTNLASTGQTTTSITLSWTASTDNVGVTGYKIYRGGTQVGTSTTANYTDTGLTANTQYSYTVSAYDAAGNNSAQCSAIYVSTNAGSTNLLSNNSFESGSTNWETAYESISTVSSNPSPEDGSYSLLASGRAQVASWAGQDVLSIVQSKGQGSYTVSAWIRTPSVTDTFSVALSILVNGAWTEYDVTATANSSGWTQITGVINASWSGTLTDAVFLVRQNDNTNNYYIDNCSLAYN